MTPRWKRPGRLLPTALVVWANWTASAQDALPRPNGSEQASVHQSNGLIPSSQPTATASPQLSPQASGSPVPPTMQSTVGPIRTSDRAALARLRNPFAGEPVEKRGLLGVIAPRPSPQYPGLPPTAVSPGVVPPPGAGQMGGLAAPLPGEGGGPGAGGLPGAEAQPSAAAPAIGAAPAATAAAEAFAAATGPAGPGFGGSAGAVAEAFPMIGDRGPLFLRQNLRFPPIPTPIPPPGTNSASLVARSGAAIVPAVRGFKIADNQYPRPVDRVWVSFNYYDGVNSGINEELRAPIKNMQVYRETFGFEKTFLAQTASVGFRIPVDTLTISSGFPRLSGTHTSTGNFSSYFKYVLLEDNRGNLLSAGLDMYFPTGPKSFAGFPSITGNQRLRTPAVSRLPLQVGRSVSSGIQLDFRSHGSESRHHVLLRHRGGVYRLPGTGSSGHPFIHRADV